MDRTHKLTIALVAALSIVVTIMLVQNDILRQKQKKLEGNRREAFLKQYEVKIAENAKIYKDVVGLIEKGNHSEALAQLDVISEKHPDNPQTLIYRAQIQVGLGKLAEPIQSYREAIGIEPGYIDKKTPLFIGKEILKLVDEAKVKLNREIKLKPNDRTLRIALENSYYLLRRLKGGCE